MTLYNLVLVFLNCHIFIAQLFQVIPSNTNRGYLHAGLRSADICIFIYINTANQCQAIKPGS